MRDVADAHIEAMTSETARANRTIVATDPSSLIDVAAVLRERLPEASGKIPTRAMTTWLTRVASVFEPQLRDVRWLIASAQRFDHGPAEALLARPLPDAIEATGRSLAERGLVRGLGLTRHSSWVAVIRPTSTGPEPLRPRPT